MIKEEVIVSLKMAIGVIVATLIAKALNLEFHNTVTTIVIVSILSSKQQSIKLSATLIVAGIYSLGLAALLFTIFDFSLGVFALYIFTFVLSMHRFDTKSAIITNVVLVMQIYFVESITVSILINQFALMVIGLITALVFNYFTLDIEGELIAYKKRVDKLYGSILENMGKCLNDECEKGEVKLELEKLNKLLSKGKSRSYDYLNSFYIKKENYYVEYFIMRTQQYKTLLAMENFIKLKFLNKEEVKLLRDFTDHLVGSPGLLEECKQQMKDLKEIEYHFTHIADLPTTKKQLHNRVALYRYLYGLLNLVELKMDFVKVFDK